MKTKQTPDQPPSLDELIEFSPVSCIFCKSNHRKCDRKKPKCDACQMRGFECTYAKTMRRKLKKQIIHDQLEQDYNMIDFYFNLASYGLPMVEKEELKRFVTLIVENGGDIPKDKQEDLQLFEMAAVFYSIKAICECFTGTMEDAEKASVKSKDYLSNVFDRYSSILVVACYYYLCWFDFLVGKVESSQFYRQILMFIKQKFENTTKQLTNFERNAYECICHVDEFMFNHEGNVREMNFELFLQSIPRVYIFDKSCLPNGWNYHLKNPHLINSTNCFQVWTMLEMILHEARENDLKLSPNMTEIINLFYNITESGTRLAILSKASLDNNCASTTNNNSSIIEHALERSASIIANAATNIHFKTLPLEIMIHIATAASYHLQKVNETSGILQSNPKREGASRNYFELLSMELEAYQIFKQKFSITETHFSSLFSKIEQLILY